MEEEGMPGEVMGEVGKAEEEGRRLVEGTPEEGGRTEEEEKEEESAEEEEEGGGERAGGESRICSS